MNTDIFHSLWPVASLDAGGEVAQASPDLLAMLDLPAINRSVLSERFEVMNAIGDPLPPSDHCWSRASRGEEFEVRQIWYDRRTGRRLFLRIRARPLQGTPYLGFEDETKHGLAMELAEVVGGVAASYLDLEDGKMVAHVTVELFSRVMRADVVYLTGTASEERLGLKVLASVGVPRGFLNEPSLIPIDAAYFSEIAARTGDIQQMDDLEKLSEREYGAVRGLLKIGMRSFAVVPLMIGVEAVGVVSFARKQPGRFLPFEFQILRSLSEASAIALKRSNTLLSKLEMSRRFQTVRDVVLSIEAGQPLRALLKDLVKKACDLTGARYGALGILNRNGDKPGLQAFITVGIDEETEKLIGHLPEGRGLLGAVIDAKRPIRVAHLERDPRSVGVPAHHPKMTSFLGVPLRVGNEVFGNFYLTDKDGGVEFTKADEELIELFGIHAALAVGYARQLELTAEEQKTSEEHFRELEKLRDEFAAIVAHDLRNPIQAISTIIEILLRPVKAGQSHLSVPVSTLRQIQNAGFRLSQMATDLLDSARIEVSRISLYRENTQPASLVREIVEATRPTLGKHPISIEGALSLPEISVDRVRIAQVLNNLLENAAKYSLEDAPITVRVAQAGGGCLISVEDRGMGITAEELPLLFDRFFQTKKARERRIGLGLGLYIARGLTEAHGGRVWAESAPGKGSKFYVWLPFLEKAAREAA